MPDIATPDAKDFSAISQYLDAATSLSIPENSSAIEAIVMLRVGGDITNVQQMVSLSALLGHLSAIQVSAPPGRTVATAERYVWALLGILGIACGILAGFAFAGDGPIRPLTGILACLGVVVLQITLIAWGREQTDKRRRVGAR